MKRGARGTVALARHAAILLALASLTAAPAAAQSAAPGVASVAQPAPQPLPRPRVRLLATGGTISNRTGGRLTADELIASVPGLDRHVTAEAEQFSNVASGELTIPQLIALAARANEVLAADPALAGVVVTCGTDTLEEIAYFLHLTVRDERPVVVVGSMRNPSTLGYEGAANLLAGFRVASSPESRGLGALVVLNDEIHAAREVTKSDAVRLQTFTSRPAGVLGVVDLDRVVYYRKPVKRAGARGEFDLSGVAALPRVDILLVYQDAPADLVTAAVDRGARGLVLAGAGAGGTSGTQGEALRLAAARGVVVVVATRTGSGRIPAREPSADGDPSARMTVGSEDLAPLKARILLMLALSRTSDPREIQRMFTEY